MRELRFKYNTTKFRYEAWAIDPEDQLDPYLISVLTESDIVKSIYPRQEAEAWRDICVNYTTFGGS